MFLLNSVLKAASTIRPIGYDPSVGSRTSCSFFHQKHALTKDIRLVALVQYAEFESTAEGRYTSPYHKQYPDDSINEYIAGTMLDLIRSDQVCVVMEDIARMDESRYTDAAISDDDPSSAAQLDLSQRPGSS